MLDRVDRIQMTSTDAQSASRRWGELLDATVAAEDVVAQLDARRVTIQVGDSLVEILEPTGPGIAQQHLDQGRGGPFSIGVTTQRSDELRTHLANLDISGIEFGDQLLLQAEDLGIPGLNVLVSPEQAREPVGLMKNLYEATHLTADAAGASAGIARVFGLDAEGFVPISSEQYGYAGALTLFDASRLHRVETIHPYDESKTMGRFFKRFGPCMYMCYGETDHLGEIRERMKANAPADWTGSDDDDDGMFIHPRALGGVMLGISRTTHAWTWSGYPERRVPA